MEEKIRRMAAAALPLAQDLLREAIRVPADWVDRPIEDGGDPECGTSNHEGPRVRHLERRLREIGAIDTGDLSGIDAFGNLWWRLEDPEDGVEPEDKTVILFDGHIDTVRALRPRWRETLGEGVDAYEGLIDPARIDRSVLRQNLGALPPDDEWHHLIWGRGAADQLGGVVCQMVASRILRSLRAEGALTGIVVLNYATVTEEDNDGGGPMFFMRELLGRGRPDWVPDVIVLTEGTGSANHGPLGIYRGQRGRMQIEVDVLGKSCHGSMPWEGRNPLEFGAAIIAAARTAYERGDGFAADDFLGPGSRTASFATLETPSDCAVPERFCFRLDRRLTQGEDPMRALADVASLPAVAAAREAGLQVDTRVPVYDRPTWRGLVPGNRQIYPGWSTPAEHPAIVAAADTYRRMVKPLIEAQRLAGDTPPSPRIGRWLFSTDGVGVPVRSESVGTVPETKAWIESATLSHPAMFGIGPGVEENTHKIGECVDARELEAVTAFYAMFPRIYRDRR